MKVFISYTAKDKGIARYLSLELRNHKIITVPDESLFISSSFERNYRTSLNSSDAIIAILSKHSFSSEWVRKEIDEALFNEKFKNKFFPVLLSNNLEDLTRVPWVLQKINHLVLSPDESDIILGKKIANEFLCFLKRGDDRAS